MLESILNATIFKLFYYLERALCWLIGIIMELFEVFAGLEPVSYNGQEDYLINIFFSNKAINNVYWGMAIIGMILIFAFTGWAVIRKMFDLEGRQQQSMGQIIWSAIRSLFLIVGLTLIVSVVLYATGVLMRQVDYIFNNAYHLNQAKEREFSDEEYAAMGRVLATIGNYSMVPNSDNRYNLNLCFNDIRSDMYFLQQQGIFEYSYNATDADGNSLDSWQSVLSQIARSSDLRQDVSVDVYHEGVARSISAAMVYLQTSDIPLPLEKGRNDYVVTERTHLDRMIFLLGTFRAAKNSAYNEHPSLDDALRGPYFYEENRSIYNYDNVNSDFNIGFETDYLLVWFAAIALIFNLVVVILNCVARIFNMLLLYIIAPPFIASAPLDNGGKFRQWCTAFTIQSLSVFGTVIAMQLLLIYLPIVASPELVLFKNRPLLNGIAQFVLVYGGSEAAKKAGSLVTGILADQAGMEAIRSGDMSGAAGRVINRATSAVSAAGGAALGVAGFALAPVTNLAKRPFNSLANAWRNLGSGNAQARADKAIQEEVNKNKAIERYMLRHPEDAKYLGRSGGGGRGGNPGAGNQPRPGGEGGNPGGGRNEELPGGRRNDPGDGRNEELPGGRGGNPGEGRNGELPGGRRDDPGGAALQPPPLPKRGGNANPGGPKAFEAADAPRRAGPQPGGRVADIRERGGMDEDPGMGRQAREMNALGSRPNLDVPPPAQRQNNANPPGIARPGAERENLPPQQREDRNPPEAGPQDQRNPLIPENRGKQNGDPLKQGDKDMPLPEPAIRRENRSFEAADAPRRAGPQPGGRVADIRERGGMDEDPGMGRQAREMNALGSRPNLDVPPPAQRQRDAQKKDQPQPVPEPGTGAQAPPQRGFQVQRQSEDSYQAELPQSQRGAVEADEGPQQNG